MMTAVLFLLAVAVTSVVGGPIGTTEQADLPVCYLGMDVVEFQCETEEKGYLHCIVEASKKCKCSEGTECRRVTFVNSQAEEECIFKCVMPKASHLGLKGKEQWNENLERIYK